MANDKDLFTNAFVDLMASALGCIIILMLVFSVKKPALTRKIGSPRGYVYYTFEIEDPNADMELYFVRSVDQRRVNYQKVRLNERKTINGPDTLSLGAECSAFLWGPIQSQLKGSASSVKKYNVYAVMRERGDWSFGVRYYDRKTLSAKSLDEGQLDFNNELKTEIYIAQTLRTNGGIEIRPRLAKKIGDEWNISIPVK